MVVEKYSIFGTNEGTRWYNFIEEDIDNCVNAGDDEENTEKKPL